MTASDTRQAPEVRGRRARPASGAWIAALGRQAPDMTRSPLALLAVAAIGVVLAAGCDRAAPAATPLAPEGTPPVPRFEHASPETPTGPTVFAVPPDIDATGTRDASAALARFVASVPDGSTILFPRTGSYRMDIGLRLVGRHDLRFLGNGATLRSTGSRECGRDCSLFYLAEDDTGILIRGFDLVGNSPKPGTFLDDWQHAAAVTVVGGRDVTIEDVIVTGVGGDALTLTGVDPDWPDGVVFRDSQVISVGRMGVAVVAGRHVTVERVRFGQVGYGVFDLEPNDVTQGAEDVRFIDNEATAWTHEWGYFFAGNGASGSTVAGVRVERNVVTGSPLVTSVVTPRRQDIVVADNASSVVATGPVMRFDHVDGLKVTGNVQPLASGELAEILDCTSVTTERGVSP